MNLETLLLQHEVDAFNADYAAALDEGRYADWPDFFLPEARYVLQARENHARGLPLALLNLESQGMMRDRVYGVTQTIYHAPYYMRHIVGRARVRLDADDSASICAEASYAVFRTRPGDVSDVYNVGRYIDEFRRADGALRLLRRTCVYDSEMVLNSLIYPV